MRGPADAGAARVVLELHAHRHARQRRDGKMSADESLKWAENQLKADLRRVIIEYRRASPYSRHRLNGQGDWLFRARTWASVVVLIGLAGCGDGGQPENKAAGPTAPGQPAVIAGTIDLDPSSRRPSRRRPSS